MIELIFVLAKCLAGDALADVVQADAEVAGVDGAGGIGQVVVAEVVVGKAAVGKRSTIGVSGISVGVEESGVGLGLSITLGNQVGVANVSGGAGDGLVGGVNAGSGLAVVVGKVVGVPGVGESTIGVSSISVAVEESGVSLGGDGGHKGGENDLN